MMPILIIWSKILWIFQGHPEKIIFRSIERSYEVVVNQNQIFRQELWVMLIFQFVQFILDILLIIVTY